jgi:hypothetical protein
MRRRRRLHSTWSRQPPVKFLCLVANEKGDIWRDDSSSYIQNRKGKERKEIIRGEEKVRPSFPGELGCSAKASLGELGCRCRNLLIKTSL